MPVAGSSVNGVATDHWSNDNYDIDQSIREADTCGLLGNDAVNPRHEVVPMCLYLLGISSGTEHMAIWQNPAPKPVMPKPAVKCMEDRAVAVTMKPMLQIAFPMMRTRRRPKRSLLVPARMKPIELAVV